MKGVAGDEELEVFPAAQVGTDDDAVGRTVAVQRQDPERIAEIVMVELIIADAVEPHRRSWRHHEVERRPHRSPFGKRRRQTADRDRLRAQVGDPHGPAGGSSLSKMRISSAVSSSAIAHPSAAIIHEEAGFGNRLEFGCTRSMCTTKSRACALAYHLLRCDCMKFRA